MAKIKIALVILMSLVFNHIAWGQSDVSSADKKNNWYQLIVTDYSHHVRVEDEICSAYTNFLIKNNNIESSILEIVAFGRGGRNKTFTLAQRKVLIGTPINSFRIELYAKDARDTGFGNTSCEDGRGTVAQGYVNLSTTICTNNTFSRNLNNDEVYTNQVNFKYRLIPLHTLDVETINGLPNTFLPVDDRITLHAKVGFASSLYQYQYRLEGGSTWTDIPGSLYNADKLTLSARDIFGSGYIDHLGEKVEFRVVSCYDSGDYLSFSDPVLLTLIQSAPHITATSPSPTKCFDTTDGSVTLTFDRRLLTGETLTGSLIDTLTNAAVSNPDFTLELENSNTATINNLPPGAYRLDLMGEYEGRPTYTDGEAYTTKFTITRPTAVGFSLVSKTDVFCHEGSDGIINISASGGQNVFQYYLTGDNGIDTGWTNFNNGNNAAITGLPAGTYQVKVQDSNECPAKTAGVIKVVTVQITQPSAPIALSETEVVEPTGFGLSNGYISVRVTGGTPNTDGSYNYEWRKDTPSGAIIATGITTDALNNPFTIKLGNITAGKYYLSVKDKNYAGASTALGSCGIISQEYEVTQPELLEVAISIKKIISCNIQNEYEYKLDLNNNGIPDEAEDGILKAKATGGVGTYTYQWQKLVNGVFEDMTGATDSTLSRLPEGTYKILVKDANNNRANAQTVFNYPAILKISLTANTIRCNNQNEGEVSVSATGGTAPYTYLWSTSHTTSSVTGLGAGSYFVIVQDANGCTVSGSVAIEQPGQLEIEDILIENPVCNGASNGKIEVKASGGETPYSLVWSNGSTGETLSGLKAGTYSVTFTDANGCDITKKYTLTDPEALKIDLGKDITLCQGDSMVYDVRIDDPTATYLWTNGQGTAIGTTSRIALYEAGTYTLTVTDSKGCTASDGITVKNSMEVLNPEFMITTHAYVDFLVELVNVSTVKPQKVEWILPENGDIQVVSQTDDYMEVKFNRTGSYRIGLKGMQGECEKTMYKDVVVEENMSGAEVPPTVASNIEEFTITPNPNNGNYKVTLKLYKPAAVKLRIMDLVGRESYSPVYRSQAKEFDIPFTQSLSPAMYLIILETGNEVKVNRMIVR